MFALKLYNTLTRSLEEFSPLDPKKTKVYCCGPTVYNFAHIGNLRTYIFEDLLIRSLAFFKHNVLHVMNITDVGHLASDADEGEDKMLLATQREGKKSKEIAEFYTEAFFKDCRELNIKKPTIVCKATEHITEMIEMIETLIKKDFAYVSNGNVYFDVKKSADYGKLANLSLESLQSGARIVVDSSKRNPHDFALWFTNSKFEDQELQWDSPWGRGYPGWHIECSAMSIKYLGETFDIHCGGIDHIPVHHTNEIAQSESSTGKPFSKFWLHGGFLVESGSEKMSKSKGEFLTLDKVKQRGFNPLSYRYLCLTAHYRGELSWSWEALKGADNSLTKLIGKITSLHDSTKNEQSLDQERSTFWIEEFATRIGNDLNAPQALACLNELITDKTISSKNKLRLIGDFDAVLGLDLIAASLEQFNQKSANTESTIPQDILDLAQQRESARKNKNFSIADKLRQQIEELGFDLKDTANGPNIKRK